MHLDSLDHRAGTSDGIKGSAAASFFAYSTLLSDFEATRAGYFGPADALIFRLDDFLICFGRNPTIDASISIFFFIIR